MAGAQVSRDCPSAGDSLGSNWRTHGQRRHCYHDQEWRNGPDNWIPVAVGSPLGQQLRTQDSLPCVCFVLETCHSYNPYICVCRCGGGGCCGLLLLGCVGVSLGATTILSTKMWNGWYRVIGSKTDETGNPTFRVPSGGRTPPTITLNKLLLS